MLDRGGGAPVALGHGLPSARSGRNGRISGSCNRQMGRSLSFPRRVVRHQLLSGGQDLLDDFAQLLEANFAVTAVLLCQLLEDLRQKCRLCTDSTENSPNNVMEVPLTNKALVVVEEISLTFSSGTGVPLGVDILAYNG